MHGQRISHKRGFARFALESRAEALVVQALRTVDLSRTETKYRS
jgi:hypothetical protein